jgi:uncharacterized protein
MTEAIKLLSVIILIVVLLGFKLDLGLIMFLSSILLGVLFQHRLYEILYTFYLSAIDSTTLQLIGIIILVYVLSSILIRTKSMEGIVSSLQNMVADYRLILFFIASFLGLIPMPAGAMFSAPLLKEIGDKNHLTPEEIMFSNYWFRHTWEFIWPLIPGLVLYASVTGISLRKIMILQFPLSIIALLVGFFWLYKHLKRNNNREINYKEWKNQLFIFLKSVWSILVIISLVLFFQVDLLVALSVAIAFLIFIHKISPGELKKIVFHDISFKVIILIVGIMFFKQMLESTNSMSQIPQLFSEIGINIWIILFSIPFILGFLTGVTAGFIGISFPILMPLMTQGGSLNLSMAMFAYTSGFVGMMMSPMHLCFTVTIEYLKVNTFKFYKMLCINLLVLIILGSIYVYIFHII